METLFFDELDSTQIFLTENLKKGKLKLPVAVVAKKQTNGIGSRGNVWEGNEGSLYLSFAIRHSDFPDDLPIPSVSIYVGMHIIEVLRNYGSKAFLKWPNDIYVSDRKVGGIITTKFSDTIVCGVGINRNLKTEEYGNLDIKTPNIQLIDALFFALEKKESWKQIFSYYEVEFCKSKMFSASFFGERRSLGDAVLCPDGSIALEGKKYYSLR